MGQYTSVPAGSSGQRSQADVAGGVGDGVGGVVSAGRVARKPAQGENVGIRVERWQFIGLFSASGYCRNACCCGKWAKHGRFADGTRVDEVRNMRDVVSASVDTEARMSRIVAAPRSFRFGTRLFIGGVGECIVRDRGGSIGPDKLDLYFSPEEGGHEAALRFGRQCLKVWRLN